MRLRIAPYIAITLTLLVVVNAEFYYRIDYLFSRSIIAFFLLTFMPGFLLYKLMRSVKKIHTEVICYSVGLSLALVMLLGLIINILLIQYTRIIPLDTNLQLLILTCLNGFLLLANLIRDLRNPQEATISVLGSRVKIIDQLFFLVATFFPLLSIIGTSLLNNGGSSTILIVNLGLIGVYILLLTLFWEKIHDAVFPYAVFTIGLAILFNISLRGWLITGSDILTEYRMFQATLAHGYWSKSIQNHAYNACISITLLPAIYARLINMSPDYIFKFLFQIIFAFVPVIVYVFTKKFANNILSFLAGILFISFPIFVNSMSMHIRQEVAFLFFSLMILALFEDKKHYSFRYVSMTLFGFAMIISHYSTTFIGLTLLSIWYFVDLGFMAFLWLVGKVIFREHLLKGYKRILPLLFIILLYAFAGYWYTQVVNIGGSLRRLEQKITSNFSNLFSNDVRVDQTSLANQFNIFYREKNKSHLLEKYIKETNDIARKNYSPSLYYPPEAYSDYRPILIELSGQKVHISRDLLKYAILYMETVKKIQKLLTLFGAAILFYLYFKDKNVNKDLLVVSFASFLILLTFMIVPYFTIDYDIMRTTQQLLIVLACSTLAGAVFFLLPLREKLQNVLVSLFIISYFFVYTGFFNELVGGFPPGIQFSNSGATYERFYVHESEKAAIHWLYENKREEYIVQSDNDSISRMIMNTLKGVNTTATLIPSTIYRSSYVYLNKLNTIKGVSYRNYQGEALRFTIPKKFFEENKNLIYNNSSSQVYQ